MSLLTMSYLEKIAIFGVPKQTDSLILQSDTTPLDGQMMNTGTHDSAEFYVLTMKKEDFKKCTLLAFLNLTN